MKKYFRLYEECFLISGDQENSAIYNVFDGNIYKITNVEKKILLMLENNIDIDYVIKNNLTLGREEILNKLKLYEQNELGTFYEKPVHINKLVVDYDTMDKMPYAAPCKLSRVILSLSNQCSGSCKICYPNTYLCDKGSCIVCNGTEKKCHTQYMEKDVYEKILNTVFKLGCEELYIKVPDLNFNIDYICECLEIVYQYKFKNITLIVGYGMDNERYIKRLSKYKIHIILQYIVENKLTKNQINKIQNIKEKCTILFITLEENMRSALVAELKEKKLDISYIITTLVEYKYAIDYFKSKKKHIGKTDIYSFSYNKYYNNCLNGIMYFDQQGNIYPCPGLLNFKLGNIDSIKNVWHEDGILKFWHLTKDKVKGCSRCLMRYVCSNCLANEYILGKDIYTNVSCSNIAQNKVEI